jgi:hypothetical protein
MRAIMFGVVLALSALSEPVVASKCDTGIDKASARQVSCMCKALPKGSTPLGAQNACHPTFFKACSKAKKANDCVVQTGTCEDKEDEVVSAALRLCDGSPSGAFLD